VWVTDELPATATNKVLKRELIARGTQPEAGVVWTRAARARSYTAGPAE
jgi:fatty-acyl-CoA synthase